MSSSRPLNRPYCILMHPQELSLAVGHALAAYPDEIPMSGFGLQTHAGDLVVQFVIPSGTDAVSRGSYCGHSPEYVERTAGFLKKMFGLDYLTDIHSHGEHPLITPSTGDLETYSSLARRNGIGLLGQIIISFEKHTIPFWASRNKGHNLRKGTLSRSSGLIGQNDETLSSRIRPVVNTYVLVQTISGEYAYQPSNLLLLVEDSPIRPYLEQTGTDRKLGVVFNTAPYPIDSISIPRLLKFDEAPAPPSEPPSSLLKECHELYDHAAIESEIFLDESYWTVRIRIDSQFQLFVVYESLSPVNVRLRSVYLRDNASHNFVEITDLISSNLETSSVKDIFNKVLKFVRDGVNSRSGLQGKVENEQPPQVASVDTTKRSVHTPSNKTRYNEKE